MSIDFARVQSLFQAVADMPARDRVAELERACAGDAELRRQVAALLQAHDDAVELPSVESTGAYVPDVEPGQFFDGRYKLREKLGEGGMGVVFVADQIEPVQRRVALKIIRTGFDTQRLIARFEQERQALALMDHPNIAKVFDAGICRAGIQTKAGANEANRLKPGLQPIGLPYFAMELVKGLPLTKYCDEARLTSRQRIELFVPVCQAVQHAHQKGIIHRDLKPSNILVGLYDGRPVPKVIDFGVAKATGPRLTEQSIYTEVGSIIGTLEYMSPEQAELNNLDIDTRSDIYALGVILYELLTGTVPFSRKELDKAGLAEMLRVIKEVEPSKPSTKLSGSGKLPSIAANRQTEPKNLTALIRGELDWIVMKALEEDRSRRYETANGFAMDVQRYLAGETVLAAPASTVYRLRKFVQRHRGPVLAACLVLSALLVGVIGTTYGLFRADQQRLIAEDNAAKAQTATTAEKLAKERAEANLVLARESVERYLSAVTDEPNLKKADFNRLRKKLLETALPFFEKIAEQKSDDPEVEAGRAEAHHRLGKVHSALGDHEAALREFEAMRAIFARLNSQFPTVPKYRHELAWSHNNLGIVLSILGRHREAEAALHQAIEIKEELAAGDPALWENRKNLLSSYNNLGSVLRSLGRIKEAEAAFRQCLLIEEHFAQKNPHLPEHREGLASSHFNLALTLNDQGKRNEAELEFRQALAMRQLLVAEFPAMPQYRIALAESHVNLGRLLNSLRMPGEAESTYRQAMAIQERLVADFPSEPEHRGRLAESHHGLGIVLKGVGRRGEAEAAYRRAVAIDEELVAEFPNTPKYREDLARSCNNLGLLLKDLGKPQEAEATYHQALAVDAQLVADFPTEPGFRWALAKHTNSLGILLSDLGRLAEAEAAHRQAMAMEERLVGEIPVSSAYVVSLAGTYCNLGQLTFKGGQAEAALEWHAKAIARLEPVLAREPRLATARQFLCNSLYGKARALDTLGRHDEAVQAWQQALQTDNGKQKATLSLGLARSRASACFQQDLAWPLLWGWPR